MAKAESESDAFAQKASECETCLAEREAAASALLRLYRRVFTCHKSAAVASRTFACFTVSLSQMLEYVILQSPDPSSDGSNQKYSNINAHLRETESYNHVYGTAADS